jgi:maltose O-acetyltransferase
MGEQRERMVAGLPYDPTDPELVAERTRCRAVLQQFERAASEDDGMEILRGLLRAVGTDAMVIGPLRCDYGWNVTLGDRAFLNYDVVILDCAPVRIGERALVGPRVQLIAADHPRAAAQRATGLESAAPVTIEDDVWVGAGAIVLPGVTVGRGSIVGAGSVVTREVPAGVVAAGNPCRVLREVSAPAP